MSLSSANHTFMYFAYGSNMASRRLMARDRAPSAVAVAGGYLSGHRLAFDKFSSRDQSGKCDCEATNNPVDRIHGVVYRVAQSDRAKLDIAEGLNHGYRAEIVEVHCDGMLVHCLTYVATDKRVGLHIFDWYLEHVVAGALEHGLPNDYIQMIRETPTVADRDTRRARRERKVHGNPSPG